MKRNIYEDVESTKDNYLSLDADDEEKTKQAKPQVASKGVLERRKIAYPHRKIGSSVIKENKIHPFSGVPGSQNLENMPAKPDLGGAVGNASQTGATGAKGVSSFSGLPLSTKAAAAPGVTFNFGLPMDYTPGRAPQQPADRLKIENEGHSTPEMDVDAQPATIFGSKTDFADEPPNKYLATYVEKMTALNRDYIEYVQKWVTKYQYVDLSPGTEAYMANKKRIAEEARKLSSNFSSNTNLNFEPASSQTMSAGTAPSTAQDQLGSSSALILKGGATSRNGTSPPVSGSSSASNAQPHQVVNNSKAVPLSCLPGGATFSSAPKNESAVFRPSPLGQGSAAPRSVSPSPACEPKLAPNVVTGKFEYNTALPSVPTFGAATSFGKSFGSASAESSDLPDNNAQRGPASTLPKSSTTPFSFGKPLADFSSSASPIGAATGFKGFGEKGPGSATDVTSAAAANLSSAGMKGFGTGNVNVAESSTYQSTGDAAQSFKTFGTYASVMTKATPKSSDGVADFMNTSGSSTEHATKKPWNPISTTATPMFTSFGSGSGSAAETSSAPGSAAPVFEKPMPKMSDAAENASGQKVAMATPGFKNFGSNVSSTDFFSEKKTATAGFKGFGTTSSSTADSASQPKSSKLTVSPKEAKATDNSKAMDMEGSATAAAPKLAGDGTSTGNEAASVPKASATAAAPGFSGFRFGAGSDAFSAKPTAVPMTFKGFETGGASAAGTSSIPRTNVATPGFQGFGMNVGSTPVASSDITPAATPGFRGFNVDSKNSAESTTSFKFGFSAGAQPMSATSAFPKFQMFSKLGQQAEQSSSEMSSRSPAGTEGGQHGNQFSSLASQGGNDSNAGDADDVVEAGPEAGTVQEDSRDVVGEEDEENVVSTRSKLYELKKEKEGFKWKEMGIGDLRINKYIKGPNTGRHRVLLRPDSAAGQLVLNSFVEESFKPSKVGKSSLTINLLCASTGGAAELKKILIKVRDAEELTKVDSAFAQALAKGK